MPKPRPVAKAKARRQAALLPVDTDALKIINWPDFWAREMDLKVDGRPFDLRGREYVSQVMRDNSKNIVIPKAAQMAFTISFIVRTLHWIVQRKWHHLYLLPIKEGSRLFVQGRIDPIIDSHKGLSDYFKVTDNRLMKQTRDNVKLYVRGTNINSELQEIPVDVQVWDERDRMVETNLEDAKKRSSGSRIRIFTELSTPTVPGHGVDAEDAWHNSDMHRWNIPCPGCGHFQVLSFENVVIGNTREDCECRCSHCHRPFSDVERAAANEFGRWAPDHLDGNIRGYHINQLNSPTLPLDEIMESWFAGQREARKMQSFWNNSFGIPYVAHGNQITPEILDGCIQPGLKTPNTPMGPLYIGVDVGTVLHLKASWLDRHGRRVAWRFQNFADGPGRDMWVELDNFLSRLNSFTCVIDAHPEKTEARKLALKYHGRVFMAFEKDRPDQPEVANWHTLKYKEPGTVVIDRTMAFDTTIRQYMEGDVLLPMDAREIGELMPRMPYNGFYHQMIQQKRIEEEDAKMRVVARWVKTRNPDHWHHADMFEFIATLKKPRLMIPASISQAFDEAGSVVNA